MGRVDRRAAVRGRRRCPGNQPPQPPGRHTLFTVFHLRHHCGGRFRAGTIRASPLAIGDHQPRDVDDRRLAHALELHDHGRPAQGAWAVVGRLRRGGFAGRVRVSPVADDEGAGAEGARLGLRLRHRGCFGPIGRNAGPGAAGSVAVRRERTTDLDDGGRGPFAGRNFRGRRAGLCPSIQRRSGHHGGGSMARPARRVRRGRPVFAIGHGGLRPGFGPRPAGRARRQSVGNDPNARMPGAGRGPGRLGAFERGADDYAGACRR